MPEMIIEGTANPPKTGSGRESTFLYNTVVSHSVIRIPRASRKCWANVSPLFHNRWLGHCPITGGKIRDNPYCETGGAFKVGRASQCEDVISRVL